MKTILTVPVLLALLAMTTPSSAGTLMLYDDPKCDGATITVTKDTPDLGVRDFASTASSYQIKDGNWALYTGTAFTRSRLPDDEKDSLKPGACIDLNRPFERGIKSVKTAQ